MEALCFYYHEHELSNVNNDRYGFVNFYNLPEDPIVERTFTKGGKEIKIFGESKIDEIAAEMGVPVLAKIPIDPKTASLVDKGAIELADDKYVASAVDFLSKMD